MEGAGMNDIKPYFRDDLARTYSSVYFSAKMSRPGTEYWYGFIAALSSVCLAVGVNPESFLSAEDVQLLKG